ncbi:MAG TPA: MFS transporter [Steroidobacteraceae bacterium]
MIAGVLQRLARVEPGETRAVFTALVLFFCVLCGYFMLRPVRETVGTVLGEEEVSNLFVVTWGASILVIPLYGLLCSVLPRSVLLPLIYGIVSASLLGVWALLEANPDSHGAARFFYVWISVLNLFIVSVFWTFMVDMFSSGQAKRLFGIIAAGGTLGGLLGPILTDVLVEPLGRNNLLLISAALFAVAIGFQLSLLRIWSERREQQAADSGGHGHERPIGGNPFAGITLVLRSPYLLGFSLFVILLASATTFLYFDQMRLMKEAFPDENDRTSMFARIDYIVQTLTLVTQLFFTSRIASRLGVVVLLTSVPIAMIGGFVTLAALGSFWVLAVVMVIRRAGEYALTRPGREILFTSVNTETKYKAKNLIDVVVYRGGDALSAQVRAGLAASGMAFSSIALCGAGVAFAWAVVGFWLARRHESEPAPQTPSARQAD